MLDGMADRSVFWAMEVGSVEMVPVSDTSFADSRRVRDVKEPCLWAMRASCSFVGAGCLCESAGAGTIGVGLCWIGGRW